MSDPKQMTITAAIQFGTDDGGQTMFADLGTSAAGVIRLRVPFHSAGKFINGWRNAGDICAAAAAEKGVLGDPFDIVSPYKVTSLQAGDAPGDLISLKFQTEEGLPLMVVMPRAAAARLVQALGKHLLENPGPMSGH